MVLNCGGLYWDSYSVTMVSTRSSRSIAYVPGCSPRPEALLEAVVLLQQRIKHEDMGARWARRGLRAAPGVGSGANCRPELEKGLTVG
ncbi:MAG: hypothetical protein R2705_13610 [Ilumatobacteraceae bacterium]